MPLNEVQQREIQNQRDTEVKEKLKDEIIAKQKAMKQEAAAVREEESAAKRREDAKDEEGHLYWDKVNKTANTLISKEFSGYNDWAVAMQGLLVAALELNKAMYYDPIDLTVFIPYRDNMAPYLTAAKELPGMAWDKVIGDPIARRRIEAGDLPEMRLSATLDEQGGLKSQITKNGEPVQEIIDPATGEVDSTKDLKMHFDVGIKMWAKSNGYDAVVEPNVGLVFKDEHGDKMTKEKFQELNEDFDTSLEKFISGRMEMKVEYGGPSMSPSP